MFNGDIKTGKPHTGGDVTSTIKKILDGIIYLLKK